MVICKGVGIGRPGAKIKTEKPYSRIVTIPITATTTTVNVSQFKKKKI